MRKVIALPMLLAAFSMAHQVVIDNHTIVNIVEDNIALDEFGNVALDANGAQQFETTTLNLHLNIHNSENRTKKVRIAGKFSGLDEQKNYYISGCNVHKVPGIDAMASFYVSSKIGQRVLDIMLDVPQGDKNLCISFRENYWSPVAKENISIDWEGGVDGSTLNYASGNSPINNKIKYNYIDKRQNRTQKPADKKFSLNESFDALTLYNGNLENLTEREQFESFNSNLKYSKPVHAKSLVDLHIGSYGAYKDTRMLMPSLGVYAGKYGWNESTFDGHIGRFTEVDERMFSMGRCWAIGVFNIYSYFFGNRNSNDIALTQDEMVYRAKSKMDPSNLEYGFFVPNESEGAWDNNSADLMNDVMHNVNAEPHSYQNEKIGGPEILDFIKENADGKGKPLFISVCEPGKACHVMVIDGVALTDDAYQDTLVHLVNLDNFGNEAYAYLSALKTILSGYITYDRPTGCEFSDPFFPVDVDSDRDGIVDFDEAHRFNDLDVNRYSSDFSGISDYEKLYYSTITLPIIFEDDNFFNVDYEYTNSLNDITLYALDYLSVNDNVKCLLNQKAENLINEIVDGCRVVSEGKFMRNAINVGARAIVGMVYSKSGVLVRNDAKVGSAFLYNRGLNDYVVDYQDPKDAKATIAYFAPEKWPFSVDKTLAPINDMIGYEQKIIRNGETFTISGEEGHTGFSFLKVESGGTLVIGTGDIYIGDIQLESGSTFTFEQPSIKSELHLNGNVIWRGRYQAANTNPNVDVETARGFKLIQHANRDMYLESEWHGSIVAPYSKVIMGQSHASKKIYGQVFAKEIVIHQSSKVAHVGYNPVQPPLAKKTADPIAEEKVVAKAAPSNVKIIGANRNSINFTTTTPGRFQVSVLKLDGTVVSSFSVDRDVAGAASLNWNSESVPNGAYMLSIKHNGKVSGKMISLK